MSNFNKVKKGKTKDLNVDREKRCIPLAKKIISIVAESKYSLGKLSDKDLKEYDEIALAVISEMLSDDILYSEKEFVFQLVLQAIENTKEVVLRNMNRSFDIALNKRIGKDFKDLKISDIDNILKS